MKILQLCHKPPLPSVDGGCIAIHNITRGLVALGHEVKVVAIETPKHPVILDALPVDYLRDTHFESVYIDTTPHVGEAIKALLHHRSYQIARFYSKSMVSKLIQILNNETFDIIHLESLYVTPYIRTIRAHSNAKIIVRLHNIEHRIWQRLAENTVNPFMKMLYRMNAHQLEQSETRILNCADGYMAISQPDYQYFHSMVPSVPGKVIAVGIDMNHYPAEEDYIPSDKPTLFHIGSMNWSPNIEGIEWFLDDVWPAILNKYPTLTFTLAGHGIPERIRKRKDQNLIIAGKVPDANRFILNHDLMIVPLLSGSGIRVKIVEAMALGRVVITTTVGAEGLSVKNGKHLFIANTPEEIVAVLDKCIATPDLCTIIGENARNFISINHNNALITEQIISFYHQLLKLPK